MKKLSLYLLCITVIMLGACTKSKTPAQEAEITWEQAEKSFNMENHFSDKTKQVLLSKHGSVAKFVAYANERRVIIAKNNKIVRNLPTLQYVTMNDGLNGDQYQFEMFSDNNILDYMMEIGLEPPTCEMAGCSPACAAKLVNGMVNQDDQSFLDDDQIAEGYILPCVAKPISGKVEFITHQEDNLY
jgi:ferredoxin